MSDPRTQDDSLDLLPSSPVVAAVAAALRAYYGDGPYGVVPVGGAAYAAIAAARPHLEEPLVTEIERLRAERAAAVARVVSAARAWRDGRRDRVAGEIYHRQCRDLYAAVNALDEPAVPRRVPTQAERIAAAIAEGHVWMCGAFQRVEHPYEPYRCTEPSGHAGPHRAAIHEKTVAEWPTTTEETPA